MPARSTRQRSSLASLFHASGTNPTKVPFLAYSGGPGTGGGVTGPTGPASTTTGPTGAAGDPGAPGPQGPTGSPALVPPNAELTMALNVGTTTVVSASGIPGGTRTLRARVNVKTAYNVGAQMQIGAPTGPGMYVDAPLIDPLLQTPGIYEFAIEVSNNFGNLLQVTMLGATQGTATVTVWYAAPAH